VYLIIRDIYAKLLLENIDKQFQKHNEELIENIDDIIENNLNLFSNRLIDNDESKEDAKLLENLKREVYTLKTNNIYLNTLLKDISQHYGMNEY